MLRDNEACVNSIRVSKDFAIFNHIQFNMDVWMNFETTFVFQDYETDLAAYTSGLETLLNIPIKRTMLKSPSTDLNQEVIPLILFDLKMNKDTFGSSVYACRRIDTSIFILIVCRLQNYRPVTWSCLLCLGTTTGSWETCSKTWRNSRYFCCHLELPHLTVNTAIVVIVPNQYS